MVTYFEKVIAIEEKCAMVTYFEKVIAIEEKCDSNVRKVSKAGPYSFVSKLEAFSEQEAKILK